MNSNIKDTITTYAAIAFAVGTALLGLPLTLKEINPDLAFTLPSIVNVIAGILIAASVVATQILTGKNADGTTKSDHQVIDQASKK